MTGGAEEGDDQSVDEYNGEDLAPNRRALEDDFTTWFDRLSD